MRATQWFLKISFLTRFDNPRVYCLLDWHHPLCYMSQSTFQRCSKKPPTSMVCSNTIHSMTMVQKPLTESRFTTSLTTAIEHSMMLKNRSMLNCDHDHKRSFWRYSNNYSLIGRNSTVSTVSTVFTVSTVSTRIPESPQSIQSIQVNLTHLRYWWLLMIPYDYWWLLMTFDDFWWLLMTNYDYWRLLRTTDVSWWLLMTIADYWWLLTASDDYW